MNIQNVKTELKDTADNMRRGYVRTFMKSVSKRGDELLSDPVFAVVADKWEKELAGWKDPYKLWLEGDEWESKSICGEKKGKSDDACNDSLDNSIPVYPGYVTAVVEGTIPAANFEKKVAQAFDKLDKRTAKAILIYGDEDLLNPETGDRCFPYFKPDYSPETLEQTQYMGGIVLVREDAFVLWYEAKEKYENGICYFTSIEDLQRLCITACKQGEMEFKAQFNAENARNHFYKGILHVPHILSHRKINGAVSYEDSVKIYAPEVYRDACNSVVGGEGAEDSKKSFAAKSVSAKISIIIPSKDHPEVLETCLDSLVEKTDYPNYEILVIDNGSSAENKAKYEALKNKYAAKAQDTEGLNSVEYFYDPQPFNFSRMNNIGIKKASGELVLLLNDDTEIIQTDWLSKMAAYAVRPEIGAVGAKLYYAGTNKMQHAGVTNLKVGPSHKLFQLEDDKCYYYGKNIFDTDVFAVTGACLLVEKKKIVDAGLLNEELEVAYNDIDLCMRIYEAGYRNVQCNRAVLYHYESLTRGADSGTSDKWHRLLREKDILYKLHSWAKGFDPFYNPNLLDNSADYLPSTKNISQNDEKFSKKLEGADSEIASGSLKNSGIVNAKTDRMQMQLRNTEDGFDFIWAEGWSFVSGCDNRRFSRTAVLVNKVSGNAVEYEVFATHRGDVAEIFPKEDHIDLCGFYLRIPLNELGGQKWKLGILHSDVITGKKFLKMTDCVIG